MDQLHSHDFFKLLKDNLPSDLRNGVNIIEFKDGILYAWNQSDSSILTLNIDFQLKHSKQYPVQILRLISPPLFEIERLLINKTNSLCLLIGSQGIAVVKIPQRWGVDGIFEGGKKEISCKCSVLDEPYFACKSSKTVKQVRWHPASYNHDHVVVLTTEDTLRLYSAHDMSLKTVWHPARAFISSTVLQSPISCNSRGLRTLASLGDTFIDFDFTPPIIVGDVNATENKVDYPMLILKGNGDIYVLTASLENLKKVLVDGPLPMYPPDDNYGMEDASSLIVLRSSPPVVVVATCSGNVHHSMLLSFNDQQDQINESVEIDAAQPYHSNAALYIFECIELELGISLNDNEELYSSPVCLFTDPYVPSRYFCLHEAGVHAVILPIILDLEKYSKCSEDDADQFLPSLRQSQSQLEYLICTRINGAGGSQRLTLPLIGFRIAELPSFLIALTSDGEPTTLSLTSTTVLSKNSITTSLTFDDENDRQSENFSIHIQKILKPETGSSRPVFKIDPNVSLPTETYAEILNQEIDGLREEYFGRYHLAIKDIEKRIKLLSIMREKQHEEISEMDQKYNEMRSKAEKLKSIFEQVKQKQDRFSILSRNMLEELKRRHPRNTFVQKRVLEKLREYSKTVQNLSVQVEEACKKQKYQEDKMKETTDKIEKSDLYLSEDQQIVIADTLREMAEEISKLKNAQTKIKRIADMLLLKSNIPMFQK